MCAAAPPLHVLKPGLPVPGDNDIKGMRENATIKPVKDIGIVLFDGFALPDAASVIEVFQSANALADSEQRRSVRYNVCLLSIIGGCIASSSSVQVWTESVDTPRRVGRFHALFVAGGAGIHDTARDEEGMAWLRHICQRADLVYPVSDGRMLLDAAGLSYSQAGRCIDEPGLYVASLLPGAPGLGEVPRGEVPSALRAALRIIQEDLGPGIARQVTGQMTPPAPTQFTDMVRRTAMRNVSEKIQASARWLEANGNHPVIIGQAAKAAAMSSRNFLRRFKAEMGVTPSSYLLCLRLDMCCRLLAGTTLPADKIARRCGLGCGGRLAKLFRKHFGTTTTDYRASLCRPGEAG